MNSEHSSMVMASLHSQLRKDGSISLAEKALIYAQTADYYNLSLSEIGNPFVSKTERIEHPMRTLDDEAAATTEKAHLASVKRAWAQQAEQARRKRRALLVVAAWGVFVAGALFAYWWLSLAGKP